MVSSVLSEDEVKLNLVASTETAVLEDAYVEAILIPLPRSASH